MPSLRAGLRRYFKWNTPFCGSPQAFGEALDKLRSVLAEEGRQMDSMAATTLAGMHYPDLAEHPKTIDPILSGTMEEMALAIKEYKIRGANHIMFQCIPFSIGAMKRLEGAVALYQKMD